MLIQLRKGIHMEAYMYGLEDNLERRGVTCAGIRAISDLSAK